MEERRKTPSIGINGKTGGDVLASARGVRPVEPFAAGKAQTVAYPHPRWNRVIGGRVPNAGADVDPLALDTHANHAVVDRCRWGRRIFSLVAFHQMHGAHKDENWRGRLVKTWVTDHVLAVKEIPNPGYFWGVPA